MATGTSPIYTPDPPTIALQSEDGRNIADWVQRELRAIAQVLTNFTKVQCQPLAKAPPTPREGLVAYADGISWNPNGVGKGQRTYDGAVWRPTGAPFGPSGANHAMGLVPDPGSVAGTMNFLREDGTWKKAEGVAGKTNFIWVDRNGVNQGGLVNNDFTKIAFNNKQSDVDGVFDAVTNFRYTPNVAGTFLITGLLGLVSSSAFSDASAVIYKNGVRLFQGTETSQPGGQTYLGSVFSALIPMNGTTDFIEIEAYGSNTGGAAYTLQGGTSFSFLMAQRIGP